MSSWHDDLQIPSEKVRRLSHNWLEFPIRKSRVAKNPAKVTLRWGPSWCHSIICPMNGKAIMFTSSHEAQQFGIGWEIVRDGHVFWCSSNSMLGRDLVHDLWLKFMALPTMPTGQPYYVSSSSHSSPAERWSSLQLIVKLSLISFHSRDILVPRYCTGAHYAIYRSSSLDHGCHHSCLPLLEPSVRKQEEVSRSWGPLP